MKQRILIAFVMLLVPIASAQVYTITDLGLLSPTAINTWGQVVGNLNGQAFIWTRSAGPKGLGTLTGGTSSYAASINDLGVVTGTADGPGMVITVDSSFPNQQCGDLTQPFVWSQRNGMQGLGTIFEGPSPDYYLVCNIPFYGTGINDLGQVVGNTSLYDLDYQWAFLWTSADGMTFLMGLGNWPPTFAMNISNTGQIVSQNSIFSTYGLGHATSWKSGVTTDLGTLGGGADVPDYSSSANGVNDQGQVVGWSTTAPISFDDCSGSFGTGECPMHAVLWTTSGAISDLGTLSGDTLSAAWKINFFGQVIGSSGNSLAFEEDGQTSFEGSPVVIGRPFIWSERRGMQDLNTLIHRNSGWVLNSATDINVWGQIVGEGTLNGQPHGFLLTPRNPF